MPVFIIGADVQAPGVRTRHDAYTHFDRVQYNGSNEKLLNTPKCPEEVDKWGQVDTYWPTPVAMASKNKATLLMSKDVDGLLSPCDNLVGLAGKWC
jgi:hypothetical protein